jgi:glyoxylase-like metal-dependent hydrolase (beta-lactamase superfamily II)
MMSELFPGIHRIQSSFDGRLLTSFLLIGRNAALLIDSGLAYTPEETLIPYVDQLGRSVPSIKWLVITHASGDHFGGNHAIKSRFPEITIVAHELDAPSISNHSTFIEEHINALRRDGVPCPELRADDPDFIALHGPEVPVNWQARGEEKIALDDNWAVSLLHTPGHTPGHLMVYDELHQVLFAGDGIMGKGIPDIEGNLVMPPHYFEAEWYRKTLGAVARCAPKSILATHYPPLHEKQASTFVKDSAAFLKEFEGMLLNILRSASSPPDISEIIDVVRAQLGIPDAGYQYGLLVRAHLRDLASKMGGLSPQQDCNTLADRLSKAVQARMS